jgi:hypothetical protein
VPTLARLFRGKRVNVTFPPGTRLADQRIFAARLTGLVGGMSDREASEDELLRAIPAQASEFLFVARLVRADEDGIQFAVSRQ